MANNGPPTMMATRGLSDLSRIWAISLRKAPKSREVLTDMATRSKASLATVDKASKRPILEALVTCQPSRRKNSASIIKPRACWAWGWPIMKARRPGSTL